MSGSIGEHQVHPTLTTVAPRKRPRQELGRDVGSGVGESDGGSGSGSALSDSGDNEDSRQGGSQKRARSEGHGDTETSDESVSWRLPSNQVHAPVSSSTRHSSGPTTASISFTSDEVLRESPSEEAFLSLPPISSTLGVQRNGPSYVNNSSMTSNVQENITRSIAFDEQMDILRRSPAPPPSPPLQREQSHLVDLSVEAHTMIESAPSTHGASPRNTDELEIFEPQARTVSEEEHSRSTGLHALANTASIRSRILHTSPGRIAPTLPPILAPSSSQTSDPMASDTSRSMLPRLRMLRHHDQFRSQPRPVSRPPPEMEESEGQPSATFRGIPQRLDDPLRTSTDNEVTQFLQLSAVQPPSNSAVRDANSPFELSASSRGRRTFSRPDPFHEVHSVLDSHEPGMRPSEGPQFPGIRLPATRRTERQHEPLSTEDYIDRPCEFRFGPFGNRSDHNNLISDVIDNSAPRSAINTPDSHGDTGRTRPRRQVGNEQPMPAPFWNGIFDEIDSERDSSPHRAPSMSNDSRRRGANSEREMPFASPRSVHDVSRDDMRRRSSLWDNSRRFPGISESENTLHVTTSSSSSSSMSSYGRFSSRSLLDPSLSFGSGLSAANSRSPLSSASVQDTERISRSRLRPRSHLDQWFDVEEDTQTMSRRDSRDDHRRGEEIIPFPSSRPATESSRNEDQPSYFSRHIHNFRDPSADPGQFISIRSSLDDRDHPLPDSRVYELDSPRAAPHVLPQGYWDNDSSMEGLQDVYLARPSRRRFSPVLVARHLPTPSTPPETSEQSIPGPSRFRLRRTMTQERNVSSGALELQTDSLEGIIPESNARENEGISALFRRHGPSPYPSSNQPFAPIDPPPRPVEPRLSPWDVGPRPTVRASPRRIRSPSPLFIPSVLRQSRSSPAVSQRPIFDQQIATGSNEQPSTQRRLTSSPTHLDSRVEAGSPPQSSLPPARHDDGAPRVETFNELVRRRAALAEAQARVARRSFSPEAMLRPAYRLPRPSFLAEDDAASRRIRVPRPERRENVAVSGTSAGATTATMDDSRRERLERQRAALLLERSISSRTALSERLASRNEWDRNYDSLLMPSATLSRPRFNEQGLNEALGSNGDARMSERSTRQASFTASNDNFGIESAEVTAGARERQELHNAIGRRSRDDELSTRRSLPNMDRTRHAITSRDPMGLETTRSFHRRFQEPEVEVGRAPRTFDHWGELESPGDQAMDPTQSRMHRFGEALRRRRVPPALNFSGTLMDQEPPSGSSFMSSARFGRRSPSPAGRLQSRQAMFARTQGRLREIGTDMLGEPRSRGHYAPRLDLLSGSFASRYITRNLGDYVRDEDFDASYENLIRLAAAVGEAKPRGTPAHLIAAMPTGFYKDFAAPGCDSRCPICLDDYRDLDPVLRISDCDHWFHKECLEQWLSGENSCPICRRRIRGRSQESSEGTPGPSGSRRDNGSDDEGSGRGAGSHGGTGSPELTLEELSSYEGWYH